MKQLLTKYQIFKKLPQISNNYSPKYKLQITNFNIF